MADRGPPSVRPSNLQTLAPWPVVLASPGIGFADVSGSNGRSCSRRSGGVELVAGTRSASDAAPFWQLLRRGARFRPISRMLGLETAKLLAGVFWSAGSRLPWR